MQTIAYHLPSLRLLVLPTTQESTTLSPMLWLTAYFGLSWLKMSWSYFAFGKRTKFLRTGWVLNALICYAQVSFLQTHNKIVLPTSLRLGVFTLFAMAISVWAKVMCHFEAETFQSQCVNCHVSSLSHCHLYYFILSRPGQDRPLNENNAEQSILVTQDESIVWLRNKLLSF